MYTLLGRSGSFGLFGVVGLVDAADFSAAFLARVVILVCTLPAFAYFHTKAFFLLTFTPRLCIHGGAKTATKR